MMYATDRNIIISKDTKLVLRWGYTAFDDFDSETEEHLVSDFIFDPDNIDWYWNENTGEFQSTPLE